MKQILIIFALLLAGVSCAFAQVEGIRHQRLDQKQQHNQPFELYSPNNNTKTDSVWAYLAAHNTIADTPIAAAQLINGRTLASLTNGPYTITAQWFASVDSSWIFSVAGGIPSLIGDSNLVLKSRGPVKAPYWAAASGGLTQIYGVSPITIGGTDTVKIGTIAFADSARAVYHGDVLDSAKKSAIAVLAYSADSALLADSANVAATSHLLSPVPTWNQNTTGHADSARASHFADSSRASHVADTALHVPSGGVTTFSAGTTGLTPNSATSGAVTLAGTLGVANGGTGLATLTAHGAMMGNGTSTPNFIAPGSSGNVLTSDGTNWTSAAPPGGISGAVILAPANSSRNVIHPTIDATPLTLNGFSGGGSNLEIWDTNGTGVAFISPGGAFVGSGLLINGSGSIRNTLSIGTPSYDGEIQFQNAASGPLYHSNLDLATLSATRSDTLPDASGVIALVGGSGVGTVTSVNVAIPGMTSSGAITTSGTITMSGKLALANGGTNGNLTASNGGIFYSTASAGAILSGTATARRALLSQSSTAPIWSTETWAAPGTSGNVLTSDGTNWTSAAAATGGIDSTHYILRAPGASATNEIRPSVSATAVTGLTITSRHSPESAQIWQYDNGSSVVPEASMDNLGNLTLGSASATTGSIILDNASSSHTTTIQAGNATAAVTYTLPTADGTSGYVLSTNGSGTLSWAAGGGGSSHGEAIYGDGSDASLAFNGTTTPVGGATLSDSTYTMTRDIFASSINVSSGVTIKTANYQIFCTGTLTDSGTIQCNGVAASGSTHGTAIAAGFYAASGSGANGRTTTGAGGAGAGASNAPYGGNAGAGGSDGGTNAGGAASSPGTTQGTSYHQAAGWQSGATMGINLGGQLNTVPINGGGGGGAGGLAVSVGSPKSGAGGGGAGVLFIASNTIKNVGTISANGGNGSNAIDSGGDNGGGGGGGGGGGVCLIYDSFTGNAATATGGTHGTGIGTGANGSDGNDGIVIMIQN